jgi:hypothetical protein
MMIPDQCLNTNPLGWNWGASISQPPLSNWLRLCPVPNRGIAERPNRVRIHVDGVPRGRADTPGFYRLPEIEGQQVTEVGVPPLPQKNTQQEARPLLVRASCVS